MGLLNYILRRILFYIPFLFIVSMIFFFLFNLAPGDPVIMMFGPKIFEMDPIALENLKHQFGLDLPIHLRYINWLNRFLHGDLGYSYIYGEPVTKMIYDRLWNTISLQSLALLLELIIAIPIGIISAVKLYQTTDKIITTGAVLMWSIPNFWLGLMLIYLFSVSLGVLPAHGTSPRILEPTLLNIIPYYILPTITLAVSHAGFIVRIVRSNILGTLRQDYIRTARAKGLKEIIIIYKHSLRNALIPTITVIGLSLPHLIAGSAVIELLFAWPGIGWLAIRAAYLRDYQLLMGISLIVTISTVFFILLTDIIYAYIDPRIRY